MRSCHENAPDRRIELGSSDGSSPLSDDQLGQEHDVFLSFRGVDTRTGFTDHLHDSLCQAGVRVFRDNEKLHFGEEIGPQLIRAVKESKISIPIFSENYAASKWCLREINLMMECRKTAKQIVLPIFYDVTPNEVQHQTGKFKEAFTRHVKECCPDTVQEWKNALSEVGSLKGLEKEKIFDGYEAKLVNEVVAEVQKILEEARIMNIPDGLEKLKETLLDLNVVLDDAEVKALD